MKDFEKVIPNGKPAFYALMYTDLRRVAMEKGYALAIHGSLANDMDLIAVAWTKYAVSENELVEALSGTFQHTVWRDKAFRSREIMEHGRIAYTLSIATDWFVDLSVFPPKGDDR